MMKRAEHPRKNNKNKNRYHMPAVILYKFKIGCETNEKGTYILGRLGRT
jgi:hypothetical protein